MKLTLKLLGSVVPLALVVGCSNYADPARTAKVKVARPAGYLTHAPGPALTYAQSRSMPTTLPALPQTRDPQPSEPIMFAPLPPLTSTTAAPAAQTELPEGQAAAAQEPQQLAGGENAVSIPAEVLLKFFPNGKPAGFEIATGREVLFRPPVAQPTSSAVYESK